MKQFSLTFERNLSNAQINIQVLNGSLIGNAVKTGRARRCDPALFFIYIKEKGTLSAMCATVRHSAMS